MKRVALIIGTSLAAAAAGVCVALLFAPQSGEKTRRHIRNKTDDYVHDLRDKFTSNAHEITEAAQRLSRSVGRKIRPALVA